LILGDLPAGELRDRLAGPGLRLRTGPVVTGVRSPIPVLCETLGLLYAGYPVVAEDEFVDFEVKVARPSGLRRWFAPQALFEFDGHLPFKPLPADQAFPMLEWGMNWCISSHCHRYLMIHSAVVERGGGALLLPAPPGSGKSTLCASLVHAGWRLLSDELALLDPESGMVVPVPRPVSLKNASIGIMRSFAPQAVFSRTVHDTTKGDVAHMQAPLASLARASEVAAPRWLVFPRYDGGAQTSLEPIGKGRALVQLAENAFNFQVHGRAGFVTLGRLIDASACYQLVFRNLDEAHRALEVLAGPIGTSAEGERR
jgi:HprK-related kinase A